MATLEIKQMNLHPIQEKYLNKLLNNTMKGQLPIGIGKTMIMLELLKKSKYKALIISPKMIIESCWMSDYEKNYRTNIVLVNLNKEYSISNVNRVFASHIINPEKLKKLYEDTNGFKTFHWDTVIVYCSKLKNENSETAQILKKILSKSKHKFIISREPEWLN